MSEVLNANTFSKNEHPNQYEVVFRITGTIRKIIYADNLEEAKEEAEMILEKDDFEDQYLNNIDDVSINFVRKTPLMYRVVRGGKSMQVSCLKSGDQRRDPDQNGF